MEEAARISSIKSSKYLCMKLPTRFVKIQFKQENGGWCLLLRRGGVSFLRPLELLEHLLLSENAADISPKYCCPAISSGSLIFMISFHFEIMFCDFF